MAEHIRRGLLETGKLPAIDQSFDLGGIRFVKPASRLPKSEFWPGGFAPRGNSRESELPRPIAKSFPALRGEDWEEFRRVMPRATVLGESYEKWLQLQSGEEDGWRDERQPFVPVYVDFQAFAQSIEKAQSEWEFRDLCKFASDVLNARIREVVENVKDAAITLVRPIEYLHVGVEEIGRDKGNDMCTIRHICELPGFERNDIILESIRAYWEEGVCLAACYAVKRGVPHVFFEKL